VPAGVAAGLLAHLAFLGGDGEFFHLLVPQTLALQAHALDFIVAAADVGHRADEGEDALFAALGDGFGHRGHEETAEGEGLEFGEALGDGLLGPADAKIVEVFDEIGQGIAKEFLLGPIFIAAVAPFAEVLLGDEAAVELFGEDGLDFGQGVEPIEERTSEFAVAEAEVEGFADVPREAGDFAAAGGVGGQRKLRWKFDV
jgi:hypothetical protein